MTKKDKILNKFYNIGANEIKVSELSIRVFYDNKHILFIDRIVKTYEKYHFIEKVDAWEYHFSARVSSPITEAEHRIITELFDYWRKEECKKKKKKAK